MSKDPIVIVAAKRTPIGSFGGVFKDISAVKLGAVAIKGAINACSVDPHEIQEVFMGCVLPAGLGQAPARQAALYGGIPQTAACTTINKVCGSGMKAVMLAHDLLLAKTADVILAGGMENMSQAPYLSPHARFGYRLGHGKLLDHMVFDGLEDAYQHQPMGVFGEQCVKKYNISRAEMDAFAIESLRRARKATEDGSFKEEIVAVNELNQDEGPLRAKPEKIPQLLPVFSKDGTITAANASSISDGAAALILMHASQAKKYGIQPLAEIVGHHSYAQEPSWFTTAPVFAIRELLAKLRWQTHHVDLFEINEAFAVVTMVAMRELNLSHEKVNIHGGACVLGHPIGASGARILVTLIHALREKKLSTGIASLCIGGGEATAIAIKIL